MFRIRISTGLLNLDSDTANPSQAICYKVFKAGSGTTFKKRLDPGSTALMLPHQERAVIRESDTNDQCNKNAFIVTYTAVKLFTFVQFYYYEYFTSGARGVVAL